MKNIYEVREWTMCGGWIASWQTTDDNGQEVAWTFDSIEEADEELHDHISELIAEGMAEDEEFERENYRIYNKETDECVS
jgi:hypothetical protein